MVMVKTGNGQYSPANGPRYAKDAGDLEDFPIRPGLHWRERKEVRELLTISRGVKLIYGDPGAGKDLYGTSFCAMQKYYFNRRCLLDFLPCKAFDEIDGGGDYVLFNTERMLWEMDKMAKASGVENIHKSIDKKESEEFYKGAVVHWATEGEGEILLKGAIVYLKELKRYCHNRNPHSRVNKFVGSLNSVWRHLDMLVMGTHVLPHEIDRYSFLSYAKIRAKCTWSISQPHTTIVTIMRGAFAQADNVFIAEGKPMTIRVNGNQPRAFLNGKRFFDLYLTKDMVNLKPVLSKDMKGG